GGWPSPIPEEFGPLNCGQSAAPAKLDRAMVAATSIEEVRFIMTALVYRPRVDVASARRRGGSAGDGDERTHADDVRWAGGALARTRGNRAHAHGRSRQAIPRHADGRTSLAEPMPQSRLTTKPD